MPEIRAVFRLLFRARMSSGDAVPINVRLVSRGFFDVFQIPARTGRSIADSDGASAPRVVVINRSLAARVAAVGPALGQTLAFDFIEPPFTATVVGVVEDFRHQQLGAMPSPEAYLSFAQTLEPRYSLVLSSAGRAEQVGRVVREVVDTIDRELAFTPITPMTDYVQQNLAGPRVQLELTSSFALVALVVAAAGLYSLLTFLAAGSRREWASPGPGRNASTPSAESISTGPDIWRHRRGSRDRARCSRRTRTDRGAVWRCLLGSPYRGVGNSGHDRDLPRRRRRPGAPRARDRRR